MARFFFFFFSRNERVTLIVTRTVRENAPCSLKNPGTRRKCNQGDPTEGMHEYSINHSAAFSIMKLCAPFNSFEQSKRVNEAALTVSETELKRLHLPPLFHLSLGRNKTCRAEANFDKKVACSLMTIYKKKNVSEFVLFLVIYRSSLNSFPAR